MLKLELVLAIEQRNKGEVLYEWTCERECLNRILKLSSWFFAIYEIYRKKGTHFRSKTQQRHISNQKFDDGDAVGCLVGY